MRLPLLFLLTLLALAAPAAAQWTIQATVTENGQPLEGLRVGFVRSAGLESLPAAQRVLPEFEAFTDAAGMITTTLPFEADARFHVFTLSEVHLNQFYDARDGGREGLPGYPLRALYTAANLRPLIYNRHHPIAFELNSNLVADVPISFGGGVTLLHDIYLARPLATGPSPVILARSPYVVGSGGAGITAYGYTYVAQETRGRSGGIANGCPTIFRTDGWDTLQDGLRTLQQVARLGIEGQPVCNGMIGMAGPSALAINQLLAAGAASVAGQPSLLSACFSELAPGDVHSLFFPGGILRRETVVWYLQTQFTAPAGKPDYCDYCAICDLPEYLLELEDRDDRDPNGPNGDDEAYWRSTDLGALVRDPGVAVTTPMFLQTGWFDLFVPETVELFEDLAAAGAGRHRLMIGPWTHGGRRQDVQGELFFPGSRLGEVNGAPGNLPPAVEAFGSQVRFYDRFVRMLPNGWDAEKNVAYYVMGTDSAGVESNFWRTCDTWPPNDLDVDEQRLHFVQEGGRGRLARVEVRERSASLGAIPVFARERSFVYDPLNDPLVSIGGRMLTLPAGPRDQSPNEAHERPGDHGPIVTFTLPPFTTATEITGRVTAHLAFAANVPDVDLVVKLTDVYEEPVGEESLERSLLVVQGARRARYRGGDMIPDAPLEPGVFTTMDVDLGPTSWVFGAGHSLRVSVMASDYPRLERNPQTGGGFDATPEAIVTSTVRLGCEPPPSPRTSWLTLPFVNR